MLIEYLIVQERQARRRCSCPRRAASRSGSGPARVSARTSRGGDFSSLDDLQPHRPATRRRLSRARLRRHQGAGRRRGHRRSAPLPQPGTHAAMASNGKPSRYRQLLRPDRGPNGARKVFLLTATPVNNRLHRPAAHDRAVLARESPTTSRRPRHPLAPRPFPQDGEGPAS